MDHRPFEDWLLNDETLNPEQDRDLRIHLRSCPECAALERANLSLRSTAAMPPAAGFTLRFQTRLVAQHKFQRRQTMFGLFILAIVGIIATLWLLSPYLPYLSLSPANLMSLMISHTVNFVLIARAMQVLASTLLNITVSMVPAYIWGLFVIVLCVFGYLLTVTFRWVGKKAGTAA